MRRSRQIDDFQMGADAPSEREEPAPTASPANCRFGALAEPTDRSPTEISVEPAADLDQTESSGRDAFAAQLYPRRSQWMIARHRKQRPRPPWTSSRISCAA